MKLLNKLNKLNQYYSYNIFAFNGINILLMYCYLMYYYVACMKTYGSGSWMAAIAWLKFMFGCFIFAVFIIVFIVWLLEKAFDFKINNNFVVNNKILKIIRSTFAIISLCYISVYIFSFIQIIFTMFL